MSINLPLGFAVIRRKEACDSKLTTNHLTLFTNNPLTTTH